METKLKKSLKNKEIPLLHGASGTGKTHIVKRLIKPVQRHKFYLTCPLEPNEWENMTYGVENNPKQCVVIDNLEAADIATVRAITTWLSDKKESTTYIICICIDPYAQHLRPIRGKTTLCSMPPVNKANMVIMAQDRGASDETLTMIAKGNYNDYRLIRNMIFHGSSPYDSKTNIALRNPFKAMNWLLGEKNDADLETVVDSDPFFYTTGIYTNYTKVSNDIEEIEKISKTLSDVDALGFDVSDIQTSVLGRIHTIKPLTKPIEVSFPRYTTTHKILDKKWPSLEHRDSIEAIIRTLNKNKTSKKLSEYFKSIVKKYKITLNIAEKSLSELGISKTKKLKVHMKKFLENN